MDLSSSVILPQEQGLESLALVLLVLQHLIIIVFEHDGDGNGLAVVLLVLQHPTVAFGHDDGDGNGVVWVVVWVGKHGLEETFCCECQHIKIENCEHYISPPYFSAVKVMFLS